MSQHVASAGEVVTTPANRRWRFAGHVFDERSGELSRSGAAIAVERKPLEVLRYLLHRAGELVSKDELCDRVWTRKVMDDAVLAKAVSKLREALRDDGIIIRTVHGRGYRLVAPVEVEAVPSQSLVQDAPSEAPVAPSPSLLGQAERRPLTILFCDLSDSTALSERLDPEAFRERLLAYQHAASAVCQRHEGYLAQLLGDGVLLYFGYPQAREDDAERAVRAGCDLLRAMGRLVGADGAEPPLAIRVGIHTGSAVLGELGATDNGRREILAVGGVANVAARLQAIAEPNTVCISEATLRRVPGLFIVRGLGAPELKGINRPLRVFEVLQPSGVRTRLEGAERLTTFVGREPEQSLLIDSWNRTLEGQGCAVLITAEPGLGKSRLLIHLREQLRELPHTWLECRANPRNSRSAYQPVIEMLGRGLGFREDDPQDTRLQRLESALDAIDCERAAAVPLIAPLLGLRLPERYSASHYGPELRHRKTQELLVTWLCALAERQAVVLCCEDLHWADASTVELIGLLLDHLAATPMLVLLTARPEFVPPWAANRRQTTHIGLHPLGRAHAEAMLASLSQNAPLPDTVRQRVLARASGVPLFIEELTQALLESGDPELAAIPDSLQDLLMARLDRQGTAKELAQIAAVIGGEIPHALLADVSGCAQADLQRRLHTLTDAGLLCTRGLPPRVSYLFKHALIRDAAYESLLKSTRRQLHGKTAEVLEQHFEDLVAQNPGALAAHYEQAGNLQKAVHHYRLAAGAAIERSAYAEATAHCEHALDLCNQLPESAQRARQELDLLLLYGNERVTTLGWAHSSVKRAFERAHGLCPRVNDPFMTMRALVGLWQYCYVRGEVAPALELVEEISLLAGATQNPFIALVARGLEITSANQRGEWARVFSAVERDPLVISDEHSNLIRIATGIDGASYSYGQVAHACWIVGYPDRALAFANKARDRAGAAKHPYSMAFTQAISVARIYNLRRQPREAASASAGGLEVAERFGFSGIYDHNMVDHGLALASCGDLTTGLQQARDALDRIESSGSRLWHASYCALEAEICITHGRLDEALAALERTEKSRDLGQHQWDAEIERVRGELLLVQEPHAPDAAEVCFRTALEIAHRQQAKAFELRSATSLARLLRTQNRAGEAYTLLHPIYTWFAEGFDTDDLTDARTLLGELALN